MSELNTFHNECFLGLGSHFFSDNVVQSVHTGELIEIRQAMQTV